MPSEFRTKYRLKTPQICHAVPGGPLERTVIGEPTRLAAHFLWKEMPGTDRHVYSGTIRMTSIQPGKSYSGSTETAGHRFTALMELDDATDMWTLDLIEYYNSIELARVTWKFEKQAPGKSIDSQLRSGFCESAVATGMIRIVE